MEVELEGFAGARIARNLQNSMHRLVALG